MPETGRWGLPPVPPRKRLRGQQRKEVAEAVVNAYDPGSASIRDIADATGRSYGWVHQVLKDQKVPLRPRGGARPRRAATKKEEDK
ncbi:helix-turn-helix domain-containing protein [Streptomyces sp. NPDC050610]|uniref:helix-turn-helix domain-containing protein n=1 Tax=Streptomyces sp. NPDC050610 TaxID=3157097 RepID=UPI00344825AE